MHPLQSPYPFFCSQALHTGPAIHMQIVNCEGETITLRLTRQNLRGSNFKLWASNSGGTYEVISPVGERSYLGTVDE